MPGQWLCQSSRRLRTYLGSRLICRHVSLSQMIGYLQPAINKCTEMMRKGNKINTNTSSGEKVFAASGFLNHTDSFTWMNLHINDQHLKTCTCAGIGESAARSVLCRNSRLSSESQQPTGSTRTCHSQTLRL